MKIENIGFFLATCKTRLNLPPALLFQPTDIHDDSNNLNSMSKVLNVLSFLKGDEGSMIAGLEDDEDEEEGDTPNKPEENEPVDESSEKPLPEETNHKLPPGREPGSPVETTNHHSTHSELSSTDFVEMQSEVLKILNEVINQELSIESKKKLVKSLQQQISTFEEKLMHYGDAELTSLLHSVAPDEAQKVNSRQGTVDALIIYSRIQ